MKRQEPEIMLKGKARVIFRIIISLLFIWLGVKNLGAGDYLFGVIALVAGAAFTPLLFFRKGGKDK
jgi:hypothetical protein